MTPGRLTATAAVLLVRDVLAAANHYRDKMGFSYEHLYGEPLAYVILQRDGLCLMLRQAYDPKHVIPLWTVSPRQCSVYFWVKGVDALHRDFVERGATIDYGPCDQPYGCREFGVQDIDGHDIAFGEPRS
jgi:uncharacterized glyoxalase superfamily protein PhnB